MKIMTFIMGLFICLSSSAQTDFGLIINAAHNKESYLDALDRTTMKFYRTMHVSAVKRENVFILNADGRSPFENKSQIIYDKGPLLSGIRQEDRRADGPATKDAIKKKFQALAKKMKPGDHLNLFITGHGMQSDGNIFITLWGEPLSIQELSEYLKLLPAGVIKHVVGSFCFSGALMPLTSLPNTCVFSSADSKTTTKVWYDTDAYADVFMNKLMAGTAYYDSHSTADLENEYVQKGMNSLDWYLQKNKPKGDYACEKIPDGKINSLLRTSLSSLANHQAPYETYLVAFQKNKRQIEKTLREFEQLTPLEQEKRRGEFTLLIEEMKQNVNLIKNPHKEHYLKNMAREQEFIEKASPAQLKKYLSIKACMNYAIKK